MGERPAAVNGGWGPWGQFTECSRTCGAGVSYAERECNNPVPQHRGRYCVGERKQVKICNTDVSSFITLYLVIWGAYGHSPL